VRSLHYHPPSIVPTPINDWRLTVTRCVQANMFGVNLENLVERDRRTHPDKVTRENVPIILSSIIDFLSTTALSEEGIFRKAGHVGRIKALRQKCEENGGVLSFEGSRPHDVAALLKQFVRETPEPLLTSQYVFVFTVASL
jgi:hypothetical protein